MAARLSARAALKPVQIEDCIARALQPGADFLDLKRPISRAKISVHQFRNFFSAAWLLDLVQGSSHVFVESIRTRNMAHLDSEANLLVGVHCCAVYLECEDTLHRTGRRQLENQSADCLRFMFSGRAS